jgi:hypothetical protein
MGTAVGGFGFSIGATGGSLTALVVQAEMNSRQLSKARPATGITRGEDRDFKRGTLLKTGDGNINP